MGGGRGLLQTIVPGSLLAIDAMAFIYQLESSPVYRPIVEPVFAALASGRFRAVSSVITLMEVAVLPVRLGQRELADEYEAYLLAYPNLTVVDVDRHVTRQATELRATHRLRVPDAVQVATGLTAGAEYFITNDRQLRALPGMRVLLLDAFLDVSSDARATNRELESETRDPEVP